MRIFFLIFLLAYVGGNVYIFIRALQMLSGFSLAMKILLSVIYWLVAFSLVIAMLTRHIDMPVILSKSMFHDVDTEIPRCFSISIQSEVAVLRILLFFTAPAT